MSVKAREFTQADEKKVIKQVKNNAENLKFLDSLDMELIG